MEPDESWVEWPRYSRSRSFCWLMASCAGLTPKNSILSLRAFPWARIAEIDSEQRGRSPLFQTPDETGIIDLVLKEAFRRVVIEISIIFVPAERALRNVNDGIEDGNFLRIAGMSDKYPELVQLPEKLVVWEFVAFSRKVGVEM